MRFTRLSNSRGDSRKKRGVSLVASRETYDKVREQARAACAIGNLEEASILWRQTIEIATELEDRTLRARAFGNLAGVEIALGNLTEYLPELEEILGTADCSIAGYLAAYNISNSYYRQKEYRKGSFYLHMAFQAARKSQREDWVGNCFNLKGNIEIAEGNAENAVGDYLEALKRLPEGSSVAKGAVLDNLGYCCVITGSVEEGMKRLYESYEMLKELGANYGLMFLHLDLSYTLLEVADFSEALSNAQRALDLAETIGGQEELVNALYLCGEAALGIGEDSSARFYFERVQKLYPKAPMLTEFLMQVDIRQIINLKA